MAPKDVNFENAGLVFDRLYGRYFEKKREQPPNPHFSIGQKVRIVLPSTVFKKGIFSDSASSIGPNTALPPFFFWYFCCLESSLRRLKISAILGYKQAFSDEIYRITRVYKTFPPRYAVEDNEGDELDSKKWSFFVLRRILVFFYRFLETYYSHELKLVTDGLV